MTDFEQLIKGKTDCECGREHMTAVEAVCIGRGLAAKCGEVLMQHDFSSRLLLVSDHNCLQAAASIIPGLSPFICKEKIYDDLRVASMKEVNEIEAILQADKTLDVISVGSGSLNDICRLSCARQNRRLCLFGTAPSMDGFASYSSPIVADGFKYSYPARSPQVIMADTDILAAAPVELKAAGFGDMIAKYPALCDWKISALVSDETYCDYVGDLTKTAADQIFSLADQVREKDPETAGEIFSALVKTGLGMSFMQNSRPASGAEHIVAHLEDCMEILEGKTPNFHGVDVGVATLEIIRLYKKLGRLETIETHPEQVNWEAVYQVYGPLSESVRKLNEPDTILSSVDPEKLKQSWPQIRQYIDELPSYESCLEAMKKAGCITDFKMAGKDSAFFRKCLHFSPYMRRRITLLRLLDMIDLPAGFFDSFEAEW